jgi:hypothetical protein
MSSSGWINWITSVARARSVLAGVFSGVIALCSATLVGAQSVSGDVAFGRLRIDASALRAGQFVYQTTLEREASTTILGTRTVTVSQATYAGSPVWLLLEARTGNRMGAVDSLFTDLLTLRPLHWSASQGESRLVAEFRSDTAFGGTSALFGGRRSIIAPVASGTLVNGAMLETALRLTPLQTAWEDSATTLSVTLSGLSVLPTRISVIGEDQIRVPAGTFDCWVVSVHAGEQARGLYWISKRDPIVVRSTLDVPMLGGAQLVSALTRFNK